MKTFALSAIVIVSALSSADVAIASTPYDGPWNLSFVTRSGACDPSYNFSVVISNGHVTHPNLVKFTGYVQRSGSVRASVAVQDKYASGTGRLLGSSGKGSWSGYSGSSKCSGYWTAERG